MSRFLFFLLAISVVLNIIFLGSLNSAHSSYPLLSPRIFVQDQNDIIINFTDLRKELRSFVPTYKDIRTGVYFEYLPSGVSIGINEKDNFISASLIKVPFIMGIMKLMETGKVQGDSIITLKKEDLDPAFGTLWKRGVGATLTVDEAIQLALKESDNTAAIALDHFSEADPIRKVYDALDIPVNWADDQPVVNPKNYSSVFRCLYLSCYLNYAGSQKILSLLTQTIFHDGLPAGVPKQIPVAHKIGMYDSPNSNKRVRLDCGIVYVPKRPYILCVLGEVEKGQEKQMSDFTKEVSGIVYRFVATMNDN
jgi:beta-lactamase class A